MTELVMNKNQLTHEQQLLTLIRDFISEFKSERALNTLNVDAHLERDLGIDSLGRVELFLRVEKAFGIQFPSDFMSEANTVQDILEAIAKTALSTPKILPTTFIDSLKETHFKPQTAQTLLEVLIQHAKAEPNRPHVYLQDDFAKENILRYGDLLASSQKVAGGLYELGLQQNQTVAIMLPSSADFFYAFFGVLFAGGIPVPIYPPLRADRIEEYALREANILNNAEVRILITFSKLETLSKLLKGFIKSLRTVTTVDNLLTSTVKAPLYKVKTDDPAFIQYTSGSTSDPKGVLLTHQNLLANIQAYGKVIDLNSKDVGVSWLPLYHDMGLIGSWLGSLYHAFPLTLLSPLTFLNRPERWLWAIHYHRATLSAGPNFAYELCVRKIDETAIQGLDLSSWRLAFNGAEAINPKTLERFSKKFAPYGFRKEAFYPVYGLAESTVALTFPPLNRAPRIDNISREGFEKENKAIKASEMEIKTSKILQFVACGKPLPKHDIRIVDVHNKELPERVIGNLQFKGPSSMQGYYHNIEATKAAFHNGWWDTGDFAYIADGEVFITGRKKDLIIKAGRNLYPQEIEEVASQIADVRKGSVVAFGISDPKWGTEKLVLIAETAQTQSERKAKIHDEIIEKISITLGIGTDEVILVPPRTIPKTSSGKLQRSRCKQLYLEGKLSKKGLPVWVQMAKLFLKSSWYTVNQKRITLSKIAYTFYIALLLLIFIPITWFSLLLLPKKLCGPYFKGLTQLFLKFSGLSIQILGKENLAKAKPMIYIANHTSYLDALLLKTFLPSDALFIAKKELKKWLMIGKNLKKLGILTIDRMDFTKNLEDTENIDKKLREKYSIVIFPEGTFSYAAGLRPFKMGAFKLSVDTGIPLCPIAIQGTRSIIRGDSVLLTPHLIKIIIGEPLYPTQHDWQEVTRLHSKARAQIAENCGELIIDLIAATIPSKNNKL